MQLFEQPINQGSCHTQNTWNIPSLPGVYTQQCLHEMGGKGGSKHIGSYVPMTVVLEAYFLCDSFRHVILMLILLLIIILTLTLILIIILLLLLLLLPIQISIWGLYAIIIINGYILYPSISISYCSYGGCISILWTSILYLYLLRYFFQLRNPQR